MSKANDWESEGALFCRRFLFFSVMFSAHVRRSEWYTTCSDCADHLGYHCSYVVFGLNISVMGHSYSRILAKDITYIGLHGAMPWCGACEALWARQPALDSRQHYWGATRARPSVAPPPLLLTTTTTTTTAITTLVVFRHLHVSVVSSPVYCAGLATHRYPFTAKSPTGSSPGPLAGRSGAYQPE